MYFAALASLRDFFARAEWGGKPVVTVFASPDRAHTEAAKVFAQRSGLKRQQVEDQAAMVPFMSIWRTHPTFDQSRDSRAVIRGFNRNIKAGTALKMLFPIPKVCDVQVDLWCGEAGQRIAEVVSAQVDMQFRAESVYLPIDWSLDKWYEPPFDIFAFAKVYGKTRSRLIQAGSGWSDNTSLELAQGNKEVRLTWTGRFEFYLPQRPEEARLARDLVIDLIDQDSSELLERLNVSAED